MEAKYTPGPWMQLSSNNITNAAGPDWANNAHLVAEWNEDNPCARANARLIAAAPEMLEALRNLVNCPDYRNIKTHEMNIAQAVITKAEGK